MPGLTDPPDQRLRYIAVLIERLASGDCTDTDLMDRIERLLGLVSAPAPVATASDHAPNIPEPIPASAPSDAERTAASRRRGTARSIEVRQAAGTVRPRTLPAELTARQAQILEVVTRHGGDRKAAAAELGCIIQNVDTILMAVAAKGRIPAEVLAALPARYSQAVQP